MSNTQLDIILVVRNGGLTEWENSSYCLQQGELGIAYWNNGTKNITVKAGVDGLTPWKDCPQVEGVFEQDLVFTEKFGLYTPDGTGNVVVPAKGKTMTELLTSAFTKEDTNFDTMITKRPKINLAVTGTKSAEVGSYYEPLTATLTLDDSAAYKYGAKKANGAEAQADVDFVSAMIRIDDLVINTSVNSNEPLSCVYNDLERQVINGPTVFLASCSATYSDDVNRAVTNLGRFVEKVDGQYLITDNFEKAECLRGATLSGSSAITVTGYRNSFYGALLNKDELTSDLVRGLNKSGKALTKGSTFNVSVPEGARRVVIAYPISLDGPESTLKILDKNDSNSDITSGFVKTSLNIEGANGYEAIEYRVCYIDFAQPYDRENTYVVTI